MSQFSKVKDFLTTMCSTRKCISRRWTRMNCCIKSLFIQNIHLKESWNHNLSDSTYLNPEADRPRDLTYKPKCVVTTNPNRSVLITIITWHFQSNFVNVSILHLKYEYGAQRKSHFAYYSHCYVTWYPLMIGIVASKCQSARDAALVTHHLTPLISVCLKPLKRILPQ